MVPYFSIITYFSAAGTFASNSDYMKSNKSDLSVKSIQNRKCDRSDVLEAKKAWSVSARAPVGIVQCNGARAGRAAVENFFTSIHEF